MEPFEPFQHKELQSNDDMFLRSVRNGKNSWRRWVAGIFLVILGYGLGQIPITVLMINVVQSANEGQLIFQEVEQLAATMDFSDYAIDSNWILVTLLLMFVFAMMALWVAVEKVHKRAFRWLVTPAFRVNWSKIFFSFGLWMAFTIGLEVIAYFMEPENYSLVFDARSFFPLLIISLTLLPIQTSFEELFFRGYLLQGISLWSVYRWIPLLFTSFLFGMMHMMNPEVEAFGTGIMMTYYIGVGVFLGILTLMDDSLELALGVHAATNIYGALFVTFDSSALQTAAIFRLEEVDVSLMIPIFFGAALLFTVICARKYGWYDWSRLYGKVANWN